MKPRKVTITLEVLTDVPMYMLRLSYNWRCTCVGHTEIQQTKALVVQPAPKEDAKARPEATAPS